MNVNANYSAGTQINRLFDALGYPDKFGDALGALVDLRAGNVAGAFRNLVDLNSGLSTRQMDSIFGGPGRRGIPGFRRGFVPRCGCHGPHLVKHTRTYAVRQQVGKRAHIGQKFGYNWGPFRLTGRISGREYVGSFAKPIRLENGQYLYRGRTYKSKADIYRDARDGRVDGQATSFRTKTTWSLRPGHSHCIPPFFGANLGNPLGGLINGAASALNPFGAAGSILNQIFNQPGGIFGGIPAGIPGVSGGSSNGSSSNGASGAGSSAGGPSVLSNPNLTMEDKLALLMAKLSEHLDKQIEQKMGEIEKAMQQEKGGKNGKGGAGGIGGILGSVGSIAGGAAGMYFGGPIGASIGSQLGGQIGGALGSAANGAGGAGAAGGANGQKPNLQLLQTQLQQLLQKRQQMFQTMSSILKSLHDTSMNAIRNLKA